MCLESFIQDCWMCLIFIMFKDVSKNYQRESILHTVNKPTGKLGGNTFGGHNE